MLPTEAVRGAQAQERRPIEVADLFEMRSVGAPVVSPDGEWIAYTVGRTSLEDERSYTRIYMSPAQGGEPVALTAEGKSAGSPGWSPDGRYITFTASRDDGETQVWALDRRGGEAFALTEVEQGISGYRWSPDGRSITYTTGIRPDLIWYATTHLAVIAADGGEPRLLTTELDRNIS